jgi:hypothetical protein
MVNFRLKYGSYTSFGHDNWYDIGSLDDINDCCLHPNNKIMSMLSDG